MTMLRFTLALVSLALLGTLRLTAQQHPRVSPHETISTTVDDNRVSVVYGRPYSKDPKTGETVSFMYQDGLLQEFHY